MLGKTTGFFSVQLALLPPKKTTNISEKNHLNTLKTMRTGCEVAQRLGRERELADNSLDRMEKNRAKQK